MNFSSSLDLFYHSFIFGHEGTEHLINICINPMVLVFISKLVIHIRGRPEISIGALNHEKLNARINRRQVRFPLFFELGVGEARSY